MAGWLAWNLRIVTGVAIACCAYIGTDYWSIQNKQENIKRIHFQNQLEWEEPEKERLKPGAKVPAVAKKRFENMGNSRGGGISGMDKLLEAMEKRCTEDPQGSIYDTNSSTRRYCRLYWSVNENINWLIKYENKHVLLSAEDKDNVKWDTAWKEYKKTNPWGRIDERSDEQVPTQFKDLCKTKANELVYDIDDEKYKQVTNYCSRNKTIKDVLDEKKLVLLDTNDNGGAEGIWKTKFDEYKISTIGAQFPNGETIRSSNQQDGIAKLKEACTKSIEILTTIDDYKNISSAVEKYCTRS